MQTTTPPPDVPGWEVVRELGRGANSTVWLVTDAEGTQAALKIPQRRAAGPVSVLQTEMRAVGDLRHEHVVRPLGVVETDAGPGLLSEYHAGGSLGSLVRAAGPLPLGQVVTVLVPMAQALQVLHARGVVHGDVSPGNILFTVQGRPALADLGSSRVLGGAEHRLGTPGFSAPELYDDGGPGRLDPAADLYSLAAVGWYALTGRAPSRTASRAPLPMILPEVPGDVVDLLEAGLGEDPQRRPGAEHFAVAAYRWADPQPLDLYPGAAAEVARELPTRRRAPTVSRRAQARGRRRRVLTGAAAVVAAALAWGAVGFLGPDDPPSAAPPHADARATPETAPAADPGAVTGGPAEVTAEATEEVRAAVAALGPARAEALTSLDHGQLAAYSLPDSPAFAADAALQQQLADRDLRFQGLDLRTRVTGDVTLQDPRHASAPVESRIGPYRTVSSSGDAVAASEGPLVERLTVHLRRTGEGWRVHRIEP
ncbi:serine/threonine-protein kinase [Citricoccus sp. NPDC055426]|uniref:serine/threonine-protein kinase n=1 Tax=Citricoccus sp. NPDC055426 TaxID=3155536 RepID=UPI003448BB84